MVDYLVINIATDTGVNSETQKWVRYCYAELSRVSLIPKFPEFALPQFSLRQMSAVLEMQSSVDSLSGRTQPLRTKSA